MKHATLLSFGCLTVLALALPATVDAGLCSRDPVPAAAELDYGRETITFIPLDSYEGMLLTVVGPYEYVFTQAVGNDQSAVFELDPPETADGCYTWEISVDPILPPEILAALAAARESGNYEEIRALLRLGELPDRPRVQSGAFQVVEGRILYSEEPEGRQKAVQPKVSPAGGKSPAASGTEAEKAAKDIVYYDDVIATGSLCVGFDCVNGFSFGFTTISMTENNTRLKFDDTSTIACYPDNDWYLEANSSACGGAESFSILDCGEESQGDCASYSRVFAVEAGAPANSVYIDDAGRVGFGTATPYVELHTVDGDTPTLRLAQDASSGFTAQTWDVAGNETNFFIRDTTNGSKLPLRIQPGTPTSTLTLRSSGYVGIGTWSPSSALHIVDNEPVKVTLNNTAGAEWSFNSSANGTFRISDTDTVANVEMELAQNGNMTISGTLTTAGNTYPDYVFAPEYELMPLSELAEFITKNQHLPNVPTTENTEGGKRINMTELQIRMLEKIEELTLYTLAQQQTIEELRARLAALEEQRSE